MREFLKILPEIKSLLGEEIKQNALPMVTATSAVVHTFSFFIIPKLRLGMRGIIDNISDI
jgi:hypothetical protein